MSAEVLLSVVTPTRNYGRFLPTCLRSVAGQGRSDIEHVVVDGASSDGTADVLKGWKGSRLRWISEPDRNQSDALNKGFAMARGQWLCWLNADEFYLPGALDAVLNRLSTSPGPSIIHGDYVEVDEGGHLLRYLPQHRFARPVLEWFGPYLPSCATFFHRSLLPASGLDLELRFAMDWDLWLRMTRAGAQVTHLPRPIAAFTVHGDSLTGTGLPLHHEELERLRCRYQLPSGAATRPAWWAARAVRLALKSSNGSYLRARRIDGLRGENLRWIDPGVASSPARRLVRLVSGMVEGHDAPLRGC